VALHYPAPIFQRPRSLHCFWILRHPHQASAVRKTDTPGERRTLIEQITTNIYRIEIPIPGNPLGTANSYLAKGPERNLIIDTGLDQADSRAVMKAALTQLGVDLTRTDFFITHIHPDHFGLLSNLAVETANVYLNQREMGWFDVKDRLGDFLDFATLNGFSDEELDSVPRTHRVFEDSLQGSLRLHFLKDEDLIKVGDMRFRCLHTPGHTPGHFCLFESTARIFLSGDHILPAISPVLEFMLVDGWQPLTEYLASLERIHRLDIERVLPGHGNPFRDHRKRIEELRSRLEQRLTEIVTHLRSGPKTARRLASLIVWNNRQDFWNLLPLFEKVIVVGGTVALLAYLENDGKVRRQMVKDRMKYSLVESSHENGRA